MAIPAPIPIVRVPPGESSGGGSSSSFASGSSRMGLGNSFGTSFPSSNGIGGSASFREAMAMATSFGKDVNDLIDYSAGRFASSVDSEMTIAPSTSLGRLESTFCRDFSCCGQDLGDLHDLLQHYEECHVRFDDDGMPGMVDDDGNSSSGGSTSTPSSMPPSPRAAHARSSSRRRESSSTAGSSTVKGKKRSFGQYDATNPGGVAGAANTPGSVQSLRRALMDGGVGGRSNGSTSSVYSANSPFSTPDSSIPGTPTLDDADFTFGHNGLSAFSALSLRPTSGDDHLPACAPPNLFFPAPGSSAMAGANSTTPGHPALNAPVNVGGNSTSSSNLPPPAKRERIASCGSSSGDVKQLDKDGKVIDKPFRCPNPGCDKAYKQANGLKYHRLHGSCNKNLAGQTGGDGSSGNASTTTAPTSQAPPKVTSPAAPASSTTAVRPPQPAANGANPTPRPGGPGVAGPPRPGGNPNSMPPLPPNINSAALAAAAALLQRGGPLPPSLQGPNGPIDSAALLKTLQMLQAQVAQQQGTPGGLPGAPGNKGPVPATSPAGTTVAKPATAPQGAAGAGGVKASPASIKSPTSTSAPAGGAPSAAATASAIPPEMLAAAQAAALQQQKKPQQPAQTAPNGTSPTQNKP
ncbi:hypothetical protein BCV69DRAFT_298798 [Microstroma glucosiphilum]|uniref:C2H2-type domain-containing protein n=1 Tax=Pseudomicrostroma glucosiphilum TaxID=1684307 RepID=A0A316UD73_9BASI|nr:hypothetical protein BCV69DRAFT_298798 [Pseudomicrostroma glucosiphilum]PWN21005.1 hypothetical protein BCV69DRAFT_298798 [Pseudomicrostroma glucosiphilum]